MTERHRTESLQQELHIMKRNAAFMGHKTTASRNGGVGDEQDHDGDEDEDDEDDEEQEEEQEEEHEEEQEEEDEHDEEKSDEREDEEGGNEEYRG